MPIIQFIRFLQSLHYSNTQVWTLAVCVNVFKLWPVMGQTQYSRSLFVIFQLNTKAQQAKQNAEEAGRTTYIWSLIYPFTRTSFTPTTRQGGALTITINNEDLTFPFFSTSWSECSLLKHRSKYWADFCQIWSRWCPEDEFQGLWGLSDFSSSPKSGVIFKVATASFNSLFGFIDMKFWLLILSPHRHSKMILDAIW